MTRAISRLGPAAWRLRRARLRGTAADAAPSAPGLRAGQAPTRTSKTLGSAAHALRRDRRSGFTLIELALSLLIVSILIGLVLPRLPGLAAVQLDAAADRIAVLMTYLADEAALRGRIYRLALDLDRGTWEIDSIRPYVARKEEEDEEPLDFEAQWDAFAEDGQLPDGVEFERLTSPDGDRISGVHSIYFLPEGAPQSVRLVLVEDEGGEREIELDAAAGAARVLEPEEME